MTTIEIKKMSIKNRIILMEEIWQSLSNGEVESPLWHKEIIDIRLSKIKNKQSKYISIDNLKVI